MKTQVEIELENIVHIATAIDQLVIALERHWPVEKRGGRADKTITSIIDRVHTMKLCACDALVTFETK